MPGQRNKGKKNIRKNKVKIELIEPSNTQLIAVIEKSQGGRPPRFTCKTLDGETIIAPIQGSIARGPKRVLVKPHDYVLLDKLGDLTFGKEGSCSYYINHVYTKNDKRELEKKGYFDKGKVEEKPDESFVIGFDQPTEEQKEIDDELDIDNI